MCNIGYYCSIKYRRVKRSALASDFYWMVYVFDQSFVIWRAVEQFTGRNVLLRLHRFTKPDLYPDYSQMDQWKATPNRPKKSPTSCGYLDIKTQWIHWRRRSHITHFNTYYELTRSHYILAHGLNESRLHGQQQPRFQLWPGSLALRIVKVETWYHTARELVASIKALHLFQLAALTGCLDSRTNLVDSISTSYFAVSRVRKATSKPTLPIVNQPSAVRKSLYEDLLRHCGWEIRMQHSPLQAEN